jgi:hypothetical protein
MDGFLIHGSLLAKSVVFAAVRQSARSIAFIITKRGGTICRNPSPDEKKVFAFLRLFAARLTNAEEYGTITAEPPAWTDKLCKMPEFGKEQYDESL